VDEATWFSSAEPGPMLDFLRGQSSDRKLRLFACACLRHAGLLEDARGRRALHLTELYADGAFGGRKYSRP
jgi:hypothetical protein